MTQKTSQNANMSGFRKEIHGMLVALVMTKTALKEWFLEGSSGERTVNLDKTIDDIKFKGGGRFTYHEVRSAEIPTTYTQRNKWLKVFEILCHLFIALKEQHVNYEALEDEKYGAILVAPGDTIRAKPAP
ncbi:hypothetical protein F4703DRAFT_1792935 [Phycomyces blakesleeanus]